LYEYFIIRALTFSPLPFVVETIYIKKEEQQQQQKANPWQKL